MIVLSLLLSATMPFAVIFAAGDTVNGAIVAGIFSIVNTVLNARILSRVANVAETVHATKRASREGNKALLDLAERREGDPP
jgi:hypothetical protein